MTDHPRNPPIWQTEDKLQIKQPDLSNLDGRFFAAAPDPAVFDFGGDNLAKLFLDQFCAFHYAASGPGWAPLRSPRTPAALIKNVFRLGRGLLKLAGAALFKKGRRPVILFNAQGRTISEEGIVYDLYNFRLVESLGQENCLHIEAIDDGINKIFRPDILLHDFVLPRIFYQVLITPGLSRFAGSLVDSCPALGFGKKEVIWIASKYLAEKWILRCILRAWNIKKAFIICHYGRESFTSACKSLGIEVIELSHGQIFPSSPFYCSRKISNAYRDNFSKSSQTPNRLGLFGPLWEKLIKNDCYFPAEGLFICGYYLKSGLLKFLRDAMAGGKTPGRTTILITTQALYQKELVEYIRFLKTRIDRKAWKIIIKVHPSENGAIYQPLEEEGFIYISVDSVYKLLQATDVHISVSSTVLFEAVLFGVPNYVLVVPWKKEISDEIVASGAAKVLEFGQLPIPYQVNQGLKEELFSEFRGLST